MSTLVSILINVSAVIAAITAIWGFLKKSMKRFEDAILKEIKSDISDIKKENLHTKVDILRFEILLLVNTEPTNHEAIYFAFDEYKKLGGNHYIDSIISKWEKEQGIA